MKHIKLFEQFDEFDPFGEEIKTPLDNHKYMIVQRLSNGFYYLARMEGDNMIRWKNEPYPDSIDGYKYPAYPYSYDKIYIYDYHNEYEGNLNYYPWKYFRCDSLPQELLNKLKK